MIDTIAEHARRNKSLHVAEVLAEAGRQVEEIAEEWYGRPDS